jgi:hypothetical protein
MTRRDPDRYCPICGRFLKFHGGHCREATYRAIDGAHRRDVSPPMADESLRPEAWRMAEGLALLEADEIVERPTAR